MGTSDVEILASKIKSAVPIKLNKNDNPTYSSKPLSDGRDFWVKLKKTALTPEFVFKLQAESLNIYLKAEQDGVFCCEVREHIRQSLIAEKGAVAEARQVALDTGKISFNDSVPTPLSRLILIENVSENYEAVLYDPEKDVSYSYAFSHIERTLERKLGDLLAEWYSTNLRQAKFEYRPREDRLFKDSSGHWIFNTYNVPAWQVGHVPNPDVKELPDETLEYFNHLADGNKDTLQDILYWLKCAVYSRAEHALVLRGVPGCGKNMLAEQLAANLVGAEGEALNFTKVTRKFGDHNFHGHITAKCIVLLDEQKLTGGLKLTLKDLLNPSAVLEEKNKRIGTPAKMSCSFMLNTNDKKSVELVIDDRKFFVPDLATTDLQTIRPVEWIDHLAKVLWKDPKYLRDIADYLQFRVTKRKDFTVKTKQFLELCWISLPAYIQEFITKAVTCKAFTKKDLSPDMKTQLVTLKEKVSEFAASHKMKKGVGVFVKLDRGGWEFTSHIVGRTDLLYLDDREDEVLNVDVDITKGA